MGAAQVRLVFRRLDRAESRVCQTFNRGCRWRWVHWTFSAVSWLGNGPVWYVQMLAFALLGGRSGRMAAAHMAVVGIVGVLVYTVLKQHTVRERPFMAHADIAFGIAPLDRFSFPSGHTLHAVALSVVAASYFPELVWILAPFVALTGLSRIVLGLHYPSDVLAGGVLGLLLARVSFHV